MFISDSRLFVSRNAERFLRRNFKKEELPVFGRLSDANKCIIYLRIGDAHIIEGSHSFYLWVYDKLPENQRVTKYGIFEFDPRELGMGIKEQYLKEYRSYRNDYPINIVHNTNLT